MGVPESVGATTRPEVGEADTSQAPWTPPPGKNWMNWAVVLLTCAIVILPPVVLEWNREPLRWEAARAMIYEKNREFAKALEAMGRILEQDPHNSQLLMQRVLTTTKWVKLSRPWHRRDGELPPSDERTLLRQALADLTTLRERHKQHAIDMQITDIHLQLGEPEKAVAYLTEAVKTTQGVLPKTLLNHQAYVRACANRELKEALEQAGKAVGYLKATDPLRSAVLDTRGYIYYRLGLHADALKDLNESIEIERKQYDQWRNEGMSLASGQFDEQQLWELDVERRELFATLIFHRWLVYRATKNKDEAEADYAELQQLLPGYHGEELW